jgi:hypothetical protein
MYATQFSPESAPRQLLGEVERIIDGMQHGSISNAFIGHCQAVAASGRAILASSDAERLATLSDRLTACIEAEEISLAALDRPMIGDALAILGTALESIATADLITALEADRTLAPFAEEIRATMAQLLDMTGRAIHRPHDPQLAIWQRRTASRLAALCDIASRLEEGQ